MRNGWTGGQYSLYRVLFGTYLFFHFAMLLPWGTELFSSRGVLPDALASPLMHAFPNVLSVSDRPFTVTIVLAGATVWSIAFVVGWHDRVAAVLLWYVLACLFGRNPLIANPALPFVGWLLLAHAIIPGAPYGSLAARGRTDPRGNWKMPPGAMASAWVLMAAAYSYSGYTKIISPSWVDGTALMHVLENPLARPGFLREAVLALPESVLRLATWGALALELSFAPLALFRRIRPLIWLLMVAMHIGLMSLIAFADLTLGMLILHLFTFDPAWLPQKPAAKLETIFYDGKCGLCHGFVRFVLAEDQAGNLFRFAPLEGHEFGAIKQRLASATVPDTVVVDTASGQLLLKSQAIAHVLARLGGLWRILSFIVHLMPRRVRNSGYDAITRVRYRLFRRPPAACPILPGHLRSRFES